MLQQTQVSTVIPYYNRWMQKYDCCFPFISPWLTVSWKVPDHCRPRESEMVTCSIAKIFTQKAAATIDEVNAIWKGLGYYSRASRLLAGAQMVVRDLKGLLPDNAREMQEKIPGIGRYSAGAICSIAYGERVPVVR
jgi:A/G-specific adenine glycosylase